MQLYKYMANSTIILNDSTVIYTSSKSQEFTEVSNK